MFGPSEESEVAVGVFEQRIEAVRFLIFRSSFGKLTHSDEQNPAKIMDARVVRMFAFRGTEFRESILQSILLQRGQTALERISRF
jgi:hypothetical protein